jgi:hypothetical protein
VQKTDGAHRPIAILMSNAPKCEVSPRGVLRDTDRVLNGTPKGSQRVVNDKPGKSGERWEVAVKSSESEVAFC